MNQNIKNTTVVALVSLVVMMLIATEPALAGPGGKIARAAFETFWGRIILGVLFVFLMPVITYVMIREKRAERRARKDLRFMASYSPLFDWLTIRERAKDCFMRVHTGWGKEDLSEAAHWMTDWYWQNQQMSYLNRWKHEGLINICNVKKITAIRPLLFIHRHHDQHHEDSLVVVSITALMQDYLKSRDSDKVVEGSKRYKDVETLWTFTLKDHVWKVSNIEEGTLSLTYANMMKELPKIESTVQPAAMAHFNA